MGDKTAFYQIVRENGESNSTPEFQSGISLIALSLHEFGHAFVNPSLERCSTMIKKYMLENLFEPVRTTMEKQAYPTQALFFNEMVVRAMTARAFCSLRNDKRIYDILTEMDKKNGFYFIEYTCIQLEYYEKNRSKYKNFNDFVPYLLEKYYSDKNKLLALLKNK